MNNYGQHYSFTTMASPRAYAPRDAYKIVKSVFLIFLGVFRNKKPR